MEEIDLNKKDDINDEMVKKQQELLSEEQKEILKEIQDNHGGSVRDYFLSLAPLKEDKEEEPKEEEPIVEELTSEDKEKSQDKFISKILENYKALEKKVPEIEPKKELTKKEKKKEKDSEKNNIKVIVGDKEFSVPKTLVYNESKKEFKIKEDKKKIANAEVAVLYLRESGIAELKYVKPDNGMFIIYGRYYHINASCFYNLGTKRIPLAVIPEWAFVPISKKGYETELGSHYQDAQMLIIKSLENAEIVKINQDINPKRKADSKLIIGIIIVAVIGLFFLNKFFGGA